VHAGFLLLAVWLFGLDRAFLGWAFVGLAAATKPQAWVLLPFLGFVSLRRFGLSRTMLGGSAAIAVGLVVCLPFLLGGTYMDLFKLPRFITETMPVASANAHNVWWLVTHAHPEFVFDSEPLLGDVTYRRAAAVLALALFAYTLWCTNPRGSPEHLLAACAFLAFGWFMVTTRAHENHAFFVLPLLVVAAPSSRFLQVLFAIISLTSFLNMTLHDFSLGPFREGLLAPQVWVQLQLVNAGANLVTLVAWAFWLFDQRRCPSSLAVRPSAVEEA
jgi:hypothetical protein